MKIAVIGTGNVGSTLAMAFKKAGLDVLFGVRDKEADFKGKEIALEYKIDWLNIEDAVSESSVIVLSAPGQLAHEIARQLGDVKDKVIIDTMNAISQKPGHYTNTGQAILDNCNATDLVKCFNTTGFENMKNPDYNGTPIDMFIAGTSIKAKHTATMLAKEIGFGEVYDFGGPEQFDLIEKFAFAWINLAIIQKQGRNIAFKVLKR